jgi:hypothetical protein
MRGSGPQYLRIGDVVAVSVSPVDRERYNYPERVLHRVIDITLQDGTLVVRTKGDNEPEPDPFTTPASQITRKHSANVPWLGYLLFYLRSTQGRIALGGVVALFLVYEVVRWMTDTVEELVEEPSPVDGFATGVQQLSGAMLEYGEHLRSHTKVVQELGGTTEELHEATAFQRAVLEDLNSTVRLLAEQLGEHDGRPNREAPFLPTTGRGSPSPAARVRPPVSTAQGERTAQAARPRLSRARVELLEARFPHATLVVTDHGSQRELLAIGAYLEALPGVTTVSLVTVSDGAARFALQTDEPHVLIERLAPLARAAGGT